MVFVTIGNATQGFRRLLNAVDEMAGRGLFAGDSVFIQSGNNHDFRPRYCQEVDFLSLDRFRGMIDEATLVICHAGAGTLLEVLRVGKVPVVMPRRRQHGELIDDHQVELVQALVLGGRVVPAYEPEDLPSAIVEARCRSKQSMPPPPSRMLELVGRAITELIGER